MTRATNPHIERIWTGLVVRLYWTDAAERAKPHEPATKPPKPHAERTNFAKRLPLPSQGITLRRFAFIGTFERMKPWSSQAKAP